MSTSDIVINYIGWGCQSPTLPKTDWLQLAQIFSWLSRGYPLFSQVPEWIHLNLSSITIIMTLITKMMLIFFFFRHPIYKRILVSVWHITISQNRHGFHIQSFSSRNCQYDAKLYTHTHITFFSRKYQKKIIKHLSPRAMQQCHA